jgi:hypothetical protein
MFCEQTSIFVYKEFYTKETHADTKSMLPTLQLQAGGN